MILVHHPEKNSKSRGDSDAGPSAPKSSNSRSRFANAYEKKMMKVQEIFETLKEIALQAGESISELGGVASASPSTSLDFFWVTKNRPVAIGGSSSDTCFCI